MYLFLTTVFTLKCLFTKEINKVREDKVHLLERLRWSRASVLAFGTHVRGLKPGRSSRVFQDAFFQKGSKAVCPMSHICGM